MEELVDKYIELRDAKSKVKAAYDAKVARIDAVLDKIEGVLLTQFQESGMESVRTKSGTAYKQTRTSAGIADWDSVLEYIRENDLWNMLERRVSKAAVEQFKDAHGDLPPGINWREEVVINVRRAS